MRRTYFLVGGASVSSILVIAGCAIVGGALVVGGLVLLGYWEAVRGAL